MKMNFYEEQIGEISVNDLFYKLQLYKKISVDWKKTETKECYEIDNYGETIVTGYEVYPSKEVRTLITFLFQEYILHGYCPSCKKETAMNAYKNNNSEQVVSNKPIWRYAEWDWEEEGFFDLTEVKMKEELEKICKNGGFHNKYFVCPMCKEIFFTTFKVELNAQSELIVSKIGEYPPVQAFNNINNNRVDKILEKRKLKNDYRSAIKVHNEGYHIAAYVYMRRIIEKLMIEIFKEKERDVNFDEFRKKHFDEKINVIKDDLPELLQDKRLYEITSAGIHQLTEEDCAEYYPVLLNAFELILIEEEKKIREELLGKSLKKDIGEVYSIVKEKTE